MSMYRATHDRHMMTAGCAPPLCSTAVAVCTRPLAAVDCETAVRQVAERARALTDAPCAHTQQVAGLLIGLRTHHLLLLCSLERVHRPQVRGGNKKAKKL